MNTLTIPIPIPDGALPAALAMVRSLIQVLTPMASPIVRPDPAANALAANAILALTHAENDLLRATQLTPASTLSLVGGAIQ